MVSLLLVLAACEQNTFFSGYVPPGEQLNKLTVGSSVRDDVIELVGAPLELGLPGSRDLYYIFQKTVLAGPLPEIEVERKVLVLRFDESDKLTAIQDVGSDKWRNIRPLDDQTDTPGVPRPDLLSDVFGNIGRFVPGK